MERCEKVALHFYKTRKMNITRNIKTSNGTDVFWSAGYSIVKDYTYR